MYMENFILKLKNYFLELKKMKKSTKIILLVIAIIFIADAALFGVVLKGKKKSNLVLTYSDESFAKENLISINSNARTGEIKNGEFAYYQFSENQKNKINSYFEKNKNASLLLRIRLSCNDVNLFNKQNDFKFGYLLSSNFNDKGDFNENLVEINKLVNVKADENELLNQGNLYTFDVALAMPVDDFENIIMPEGFFVTSSLNCNIQGACIVPSEIGFDKSLEVPYYAFSSLGGIVKDFNIDFTGGSLIFPTQNAYDRVMPEIVIKLTNDLRFNSEINKSIRVKMKVGKEEIFVKCTKNAKELIMPSSSLINPFSVIELSDNKNAVTGMLMRQTILKKTASGENQEDGIIYVPIRTDPGLILNFSPENWRTRDYEIFEWDRLPGIIFFDTRNYTVQDNFFRRLAFYIEKAGYKGRLLTNDELGTMHGFNALDYRAETLADFFNKATDLNFKLNKEELILKTILLENGILLADGQKVKPGYGAIVSISQESTPALRNQLLAHEAWHMLFFIDEEFRNYVGAAYYTMDPQSRDFLIDYFKSQPSLGYDVTDEYLMHNEFMAYILQNTFNNVGQYFVNHAYWASVQKYTPDLCKYVIDTKGQGFTDSALMLQSYVFDKYGVICGCLNLIQR